MREDFTSVPYYISKARFGINRYLLQSLKDVGCEGIVPSHGEILSSLLFRGEMTMSKLAMRIKRDRSTVTTLVGKLVKLGYVEIIDNPEDQRSKVVRLSKVGENMRDDFDKISQQMHDILWSNIDTAEGKVFLKVLKQIIQNFDEMN